GGIRGGIKRTPKSPTSTTGKNNVNTSNNNNNNSNGDQSLILESYLNQHRGNLIDGWTIIQSFTVDTWDLDGISWSPDGRYIIVWDTILDFKLLVYTPEGKCLQKFAL